MVCKKRRSCLHLPMLLLHAPPMHLSFSCESYACAYFFSVDHARLLLLSRLRLSLPCAPLVFAYRDSFFFPCSASHSGSTVFSASFFSSRPSPSSCCTPISLFFLFHPSPIRGSRMHFFSLHVAKAELVSSLSRPPLLPILTKLAVQVFFRTLLSHF